MEASPVLALGEAEAVLDQRLLARQVEQELEESHRAEDEGQLSEVGGAEDPRGDDGADDAESGGAPAAEGREQPPPGDVHQGHRNVGTRTVARPYPLLFALCLPLVFLHADYQPSWTVGVASSEATLFRSDVAVLAAGVVALLAGRAHGFGVLRAGRPVWLAAAAFLAVALVWTFVGLEVTDGYPLAENLLTLAKLTLYALLAVGAALVYRSPADLRPLLHVVVAWSSIATAFGVLQYFGVVDELEGRRPGQREPSFLGIHDFGALSGAALAIGLIGIAQGRRGRLTWAATVSGVVGVVLSGAIAVVLGVAAAAFAAWLLTRQRALALAAVVAVVYAGAVAIRAVDPEPLLDAARDRAAARPDERAGRELGAAHRARLHRRPHLPRPPARRRRLAGVRAALRPVPRRRAQPLPGRPRPRPPLARARVGRPERLRAGRRRHGRPRARGVARALPRAAPRGLARGASCRRPYPVAPRGDGRVDRPRPGGRQPHRRPDLALGRARGRGRLVA